jgi:hypothetical protein
VIFEQKGNLKEFFDMCCHTINKTWEKDKIKYEMQLKGLEDSIDFVTAIFGEQSRFSKFLDGKYTNIFNRLIYDIMVYYFSNDKITKKLQGKKDEVRSAFEDLMSNNDEFRIVTATTAKEWKKTARRYDIWEEKIKGIIGEDVIKSI